MLRYILFLVALSLLFSCSGDNQDINLQKQIQTDTSKNESTVLFSVPHVVDSSHIVIYPLILEKTSYGSGFSSGISGDRSSYWNLVFFNSENRTQHLLTNDQKVIIHSFILDGNSSTSANDGLAAVINIHKNNIFYDVVSKDFNQNRYLDIDDPTYLYVSDKQGNNFRQLSPDNYNIISWEVVTGTSKIILQAQKDSNGDKKFDQADQIIPLIVDVTSEKIATETFSLTYIDSLKSILFKTWQPEKK